MSKQAHKRVPKRKVTIVLLLLLAISQLTSLTIFLAEDYNDSITIVYFYENTCASCDPEGEFIHFLNREVGEYKEGIDVEILLYNTFHDSAFQLMEKYFKNFKVPEEKQKTPILFIGDTFLAGRHEIEERFQDSFLNAKRDLIDGSFELPTMLYFYATGCSSCMEVDNFLDTIQDVRIYKFNIAEPENLELIKNYFNTYDVPEEDQLVPIIFIEDIYLSGENMIKQCLAEEIKSGKGVKTLLPIQEGDSGKGIAGYEILGVMITGFVNGLNPCSISMCLFFFSMLMVKNENVLKMGFSFIAGKFIAYFLIGTLLFNFLAKLNIPWFQIAVKLVLVVLAIIIALLNIRDYLAVRKEQYGKVRMQLPVFLRKKNHQWIKKITSIQSDNILILVSFGLGALISVGEFLCTGQIYLATIVSVLQSSETFDFYAILYFIIYGLAFVFPIFIITILIYKGREIFYVSEWIREKLPTIRLINAFIFIVFAVVVLIWF